MRRRELLFGGAAGVLGLGNHPGVASSDEGIGELLYNGIQLPASWPPRLEAVPSEPVTPPYLAAPPAVIPIDLGRQLFVDDFLIESTDLKRTFHLAEYYSGNPVLRPDQPWEQKGSIPTAMPFSDGAWWDPRDRLFKLWYMGGETASTCYATSHDGLHWEKPSLDVRPGTNIVQPDPRDSGIVWLDYAETDPARRYKLTRSYKMEERWGLYLYASADGIHWGDPLAKSGSCGDRTTVFYNPFRKVWVYSLRHGWGRPRRRRYAEAKDLIAGASSWSRIDEPTLWAGADKYDLPRADLNTPTELYNLDAVAYESILLGFFTIWFGQNSERPKPNVVCLAYSRDGFHWTRPDHRAFLPVSEQHGNWNWGNVQSCGGGCVVLGDRLGFYCSGRTFGRNAGEKGANTTGLAFLRRDGFASMEAGASEGTLTTRAVKFNGRHLFVNANATRGSLRAELLDPFGKPLPGFTLEHCLPTRSDSTLQEIRWKGQKDFSRAAGRPVKLRFSLRNAQLYSFWVSTSESGASGGYLAAGGPGYLGAMDTTGRGALTRS